MYLFACERLTGLDVKEATSDRNDVLETTLYRLYFYQSPFFLEIKYKLRSFNIKTRLTTLKRQLST